ncbi:hypothetical protein SETIT_4G058900v2 [Setaria italica]|uniref:Uncharacterized protein n=1 Tax=Setaria italica TaxID=4555 RepID=A0A368QR81_SETIT|nr:hypothetical protein SETIT_4G058900v2 [Setaria italica]
MELHVKPPPPPPPQVACTDGERPQLAKLQRACARAEARMAEICGVYGDIIAAIDAVADQVRKLRYLRAEGLGAEIAAPVRDAESAAGNLSALVRRVAATRGTIVEMGRICVPDGGGCAEAADALADALQHIHIDLNQNQ